MNKQQSKFNFPQSDHHINRLFSNLNLRHQGPQRLDKEVQFIPPWETKIGQLQQVVRSLRQNADTYLQNRGSVIVRCYPFKSQYYMNIVYDLIRNSIAAVNHYGRTRFDGEITPILIQSYNGNVNPIVCTPMPFGAPIYIPPERLTDVVLLRVHFNFPEAALYFLQTFNRTVFNVFDRHAVKVPFVHADLTRPERLLRNRLQQICQQKNAGRFSSAPPMPGQNDNYSYGYYRNLCQSGERYFHNGIQLYKEYPGRQTESVPFQPFSELQYLHVIVASLRKFAVIYNQKECSVIIQNVDLDNGSDNDVERITTLVYNVVNTQLFKERFRDLQKLHKGICSPQTNSNSYLPIKIERVERLPQPNLNNKNGGKEGGTATNVDNSTIKKKGRPPLIRTSFRNKEAAQAFCQLFKNKKNMMILMMMAKILLILIHILIYLNLKYLLEKEEKENKTRTKTLSSKKGHKHSKNSRKNSKICLFPNAFAHRDLTPPELALGYSLRIFCREKNGPFSSYEYNKGISIITDEGELVEQQQRKQHIRYYVRGGRIFERSNNNNTPSVHQTKT
uniref:Uncharacterized protein n=1 Tax=Meloidogyne enterolobii TaxID=390850 RepID=A0A6V7Y8T8_MELEN|nr:unnamed protein product [Meloidogyne enterolobii]